MTKPASTIHRDHLHREAAVEEHLCDQLVALQGWSSRPPSAYDAARALDPEVIEAFVRETQPDAWSKLEAFYPGRARDTLCDQIASRLKAVGTLEVLRKVLKITPGIEIRLCFFKPASGLNAELVALFDANRLTVMRQVHYSLKHPERSIDIMAFVNGLPVATFEVKNTATGSTVRTAEKQYRETRSPEGEPLLTFKRGALVFFALDEMQVSMTTRIMNGATRFLPFNRGSNGGAGNPDIEGDHHVAYLWRDLPDAKAILSREVLLQIIGDLAQVQRAEKGGKQKDGSKKTAREVMIWPRYHQLDCVRQIIADARAHGSGRKYLAQHSAGSGKSNTIAWTALALSTLHDDKDRAVFDGVIVITDRVVLDDALQKTIAAFATDPRTVRATDGTSRQLREALEGGARIVISTIQKFATESIKLLSGLSARRYAVIIDEAHSSQSGRQATALSDALSRDERETVPGQDPIEGIEEAIAEQQRLRGPQAHISYLAFTATPRNVTMERFGRPGPDGKPLPFHLYSMRQAIEEEFILDVLKNYTTYRAYYELEKAIEDDPRFEGRRGARAVARFAQFHPTSMAQKAEVIVEHFRRHALPELGGDAKAMVVSSSREAAIRLYHAIKAYVAEQNYDDIHPIVAFSGEKKIDGQSFTEVGLNGFPEGDLPDKFDEGEHNVLVVAEKYQTGFDQPKLVAMYVDKKLNGLQTVQTLSRLNRTWSGSPKKHQTFILDFQNDIDDIREAFKPYFETTELEALSDPNQLYALKARLEQIFITTPEQVNRFALRFFRTDLTASDRPILDAIVRETVDRFVALDDEDIQEEFRQTLASFLRFYAFVSQVVAFDDTDTEKFYAFGSWLKRMLPSRAHPGGEDISDDMLTLRAFKISKKDERDAALAAGDRATLSPITEFGGKGLSEEEEKTLTEIVDAFNARFGGELTEADFVSLRRVGDELDADEDMSDLLRNNPPDVARGPYGEEFTRRAINAFQRNDMLQNAFLADEDLRERFISFMFGRGLRSANATSPRTPS